MQGTHSSGVFGKVLEQGSKEFQHRRKHGTRKSTWIEGTLSYYKSMDAWLSTDHGQTETKFHHNVTLKIAQSDLNQQITQYYQHKEEICRCDSHVFSISLQDLLDSQLNQKTRFLERSKNIFHASKQQSQKWQESIYTFFSRNTVQETGTPTPAIRQNSRVWPSRTHYKQSTLRIQFPSWHAPLSYMVRTKDRSYRKCFLPILLLEEWPPTHLPPPHLTRSLEAQ